VSLVDDQEVTNQQLSSASFVYYYRSAGNNKGFTPTANQTDNMQSITCIVTGQIGNTVLTVTGTAVVDVYQPAKQLKVFSTGLATCQPSPSGGYILQYTGAQIPPNYPVPAQGIYFGATILTPTVFSASLGDGQIQFAQMVTPQCTENPGPNGQPYTCAHFNQLCIDGGVPYNRPPQILADGSWQYEADSPGVAINGTATITATSVLNDSFTMYLLFQPPSTNPGLPTTMVALASVGWSINCTATMLLVNGLPIFNYTAGSQSAVVLPAVQTSLLPFWLSTNVMNPF